MRRRALAVGPILIFGLLIFGLLGGAAEAAAQAGPQGEYRRIASVNPVALVFLGAISADYEQTLSDNTSWGLAAAYYDPSRWTYFSLDAKMRYYPQGRALDGLAVGALVGFSYGEDDQTNANGNAIGVGFTVEHQWLFGDDERLAVTGGLGGKRLFFIRRLEEAPRGLPLFRLSLGWAF